MHGSCMFDCRYVTVIDPHIYMYVHPQYTCTLQCYIYLYVLLPSAVQKWVVEGEVGERSLESCKELVQLNGVWKENDSTQLLIETAMKVQQLWTIMCKYIHILSKWSISILTEYLISEVSWFQGRVLISEVSWFQGRVLISEVSWFKEGS